MAIDSFMLENGGSVVHARSYRRLLRDLTGYTEGVSSSAALAVSEKSGTPNMSVDVAVGGVFIYGDAATEQGHFHLFNDSVKNCAISAADPTNPRYDLVVARAKDTENGDASDALTIEVVQGTPAASPAEPATPSSAYVLARVQVLAAATSITNARITDRRTTVGVGVTTCTSSTRPTGGLFEGRTIYETDTDALLTYTGSAWAIASKPVSGAWVTYTPTWLVNGLSVTVGNGSVTGKWQRNGRTVHVYAKATLGSTTSYGGSGSLSLSVPFTPSNEMADTLAGCFMLRDSGTAFYAYMAYFSSSAGSPNVFAMSELGALATNTSPFSHTNPDYFVLRCSYEAAADL
jgi:hypothetical protein